MTASTGSRAGLAVAALDPRRAIAGARAAISHLGDRVTGAHDVVPRLRIAA